MTGQILAYSSAIFLNLASSTSYQPATNPVHEDLTIRASGFTGFCAHKRWADYVNAQDVWLWSCADASHQNINKAGKYHWSYNATTGLVKSIGSERLQHVKKINFSSKSLRCFL